MTTVTVHVPAALRQYCAGARTLGVEVSDQPATVAQVLSGLHAAAPGVAERVVDERGRVRPHVNVFVDGESIRLGACLGLATPIQPGADIWILPAVSGGGG
jgi:sulfur-carrier protein